jgi:hypothetical protein
MMRKFILKDSLGLLLMSAAGILLLFFLNRGFLSADELLSGGCFANKESYKYMLKDNATDQEVGEIDLEIAKEFESILRVKGKIIVKSETTAEFKTMYTAGNLSPISSYLRYKTQNGVFEVVNSQFTPENIHGTFESAEGKNDFSIKAHPNTYENCSLLTILRGLNFSAVKAVDIFDYMGHSRALIQMNLKVAGEEEIIVPAGRYEAYHVIISFKDSDGNVFSHHAWFGKSAGHVLLQYKRSDMSYQLKEILQ